MAAKPVSGRTIRWMFTDGPMANKNFEHVFAADGSVTFRLLDDPKGEARQREAVRSRSCERRCMGGVLSLVVRVYADCSARQPFEARRRICLERKRAHRTARHVRDGGYRRLRLTPLAWLNAADIHAGSQPNPTNTCDKENDPATPRVPSSQVNPQRSQSTDRGGTLCGRDSRTASPIWRGFRPSVGINRHSLEPYTKILKLPCSLLDHDPTY
jgi:hypothetical protein